MCIRDRTSSAAYVRVLQGIDYATNGNETGLFLYPTGEAKYIRLVIVDGELRAASLHNASGNVQWGSIAQNISTQRWFKISESGGTVTWACLLYTSDAADERSSVDLGGRRIIKKK